MGLGCGATCMKYTLFVFNVFFFLCGATLLALGIWGKVSDDNYLEEIVASDKDTLNATYIICIIVGIVLFIIGFLGCCGACMESAWMLAVFAALLIIITVMEIVGVVLAVVYRNDIDDTLEEEMQKQAKTKVTDDTSNALNKAWNELQYEFECCGSKGYEDYGESSKFYTSQTSNPKWLVPKTCCKLSNKDPQNAKPVSDTCNDEAVPGAPTGPYLYRRGCYSELKDWVEDHSYIFIGASIAIALIQICGILFACYVCIAIKNRS